MSFENERAQRMQKILELLEANPSGLTPQTIARATGVLQEVTRDRLFKYLDDLEWCGRIVKLKDGRVRLK